MWQDGANWLDVLSAATSRATSPALESWPAVTPHGPGAQPSLCHMCRAVRMQRSGQWLRSAPTATSSGACLSW